MSMILLLVHLFTAPGGFYAPSALDTAIEHPSLTCPFEVSR